MNHLGNIERLIERGQFEAVEKYYDTTGAIDDYQYLIGVGRAMALNHNNKAINLLHMGIEFARTDMASLAIDVNYGYKDQKELWYIGFYVIHCCYLLGLLLTKKSISALNHEQKQRFLTDGREDYPHDPGLKKSITKAMEHVGILGVKSHGGPIDKLLQDILNRMTEKTT